MDLVEGMLRRRSGHDERGFGFTCRHGFSADLNEVGVAIEAEGFAARGGDVAGSPCGFAEEGDGCVADGFEAGEAVGDLGGELGVGGFAGLRWSEFDCDAMFLGDAGDVCTGGIRIGSDGDGVDKAEVDDVAGQDGVVAVTQGEKYVGLGEHAGLILSPGECAGE